MPFLEFKNVTVMKGDHKKVLDSFSVVIAEGEDVAILGPNGAGKSSLIKTITREYYPFGGSRDYVFRIWGQETWNIFDLRFRLGIVSNDLQYAYTRDIRGGDIVLSGFFGSTGLYRRRVSPEMKKKALSVMSFLEIGHLKDRKMNEMSTGEARRFLIARALVHDPKALILDEPTTSLDIHAIDKFRKIVRKISGSGIGIVLVTQSLSDIIPEISRVVLMKEGRIFQDGPKRSILTDKNISELFSVPVRVRQEKGYYHIPGY